MGKLGQSAGFSILEIMVAVAVIASLGLGIYRLQLAELNAAQQTLTRQHMMQAASSIANQIYAHLDYQANTGLNRSGGYSSSCSNSSCYAEINYSNHTAPVSRDCSVTSCNDMQYADYILYRWKQGFDNLPMPADNIRAIVCEDDAAAVPTLASPNCSSGRLVVKIIWQSHNLDREATSLGDNNYVIRTYALTTNMML